MDSYCFNVFDNVQKVYVRMWGEEEEEEERLSYYSELTHGSRRKIIKGKFDAVV